MRVVLDTNVLMSGIFFSGPPHTVLAAWKDRRFELVISPEVLSEYQRVAEELSREHAGVAVAGILDLIVQRAVMIDAPPLPKQVCEDADDDRFIACALAARAVVIVSGDQLLRKTSGYQGLRVVTPRAFVDEFLP